MSEDKFKIKEEYEKLSKKYKLPDFDTINNDFEIDFIDKEQFLIRSIRRKMNEKLIFYCHIIESLIYPQQPTFISMKESKALTQEDKELLDSLYKELMILERESLFLDAQSSPDDKEAEIINKIFKEWQKFKKQIIPIITKCKESWSQEEEKKDKTHYFG